MTSSVPFNTLRYASALKKAGIAEHAANAHAETQAQAWAEVIDQLATKQDLRDVETKLTHDITKLSIETKQDLHNVETKLTSDITALSHEVQRIDHKVDTLEKNLRLEMQLLGKSLFLKLGSLMIAGITALAGLSTILRFC